MVRACGWKSSPRTRYLDPGPGLVYGYGRRADLPLIKDRSQDLAGQERRICGHVFFCGSPLLYGYNKPAAHCAVITLSAPLGCSILTLGHTNNTCANFPEPDLCLFCISDRSIRAFCPALALTMVVNCPVDLLAQVVRAVAKCHKCCSWLGFSTRKYRCQASEH